MKKGEKSKNLVRLRERKVFFLERASVRLNFIPIFTFHIRNHSPGSLALPQTEPAFVHITITQVNINLPHKCCQTCLPQPQCHNQEG